MTQPMKGLPVLLLLDDGTIQCPICKGADMFRYLENIVSFREITKFVPGKEGGTLVIDGWYQSGEGYDDGTEWRIECQNTTEKVFCGRELSVPSGTELEFD